MLESALRAFESNDNMLATHSKATSTQANELSRHDPFELNQIKSNADTRTAIAHAAGAGVAVRRAEAEALFPACAVTAALAVRVRPALPCVCVHRE